MMLPQPPSPAGSPMTPTGAPPPVSLPAGAGMPPVAPPPAQGAPTIDRGALSKPMRDILGRQDRAVKGLFPAQGSQTVSPEQQQAKYAAMTKDTSWAKQMAATATDPAARYWLGIIANYGFDALRSYLDAMAGVA